jgi:hypothetical protein
MPMTRVRYSEAYKRQIVAEVESGRHRSLGIECRADSAFAFQQRTHQLTRSSARFIQSQ